MNAHVRMLLHSLQPGQPTASRALTAVGMGALGLFFGAWQMASAELPDRLFGALWLIFSAAGAAGLREAGWTRPARDELPLPLHPRRRLAVEITVYLASIAGLALLLGLVRVWIGLHWRMVLDVPAPSSTAALLALSAALGRSTLLVLPLTVATTPRTPGRGPLALLRMLVPWLPFGIAASAGWLDHPGALIATFALMCALSGALLGLRRTGWESWWPRWPWSKAPGLRLRPGLAGPARLSADLRAGLGEALGLGLAASAAAWGCLLAAGLGWVPRDVEILGVLLLAAAFLVASQHLLRIPLSARVPAWQPPALPWLCLPLPAGAFTRAWSTHQVVAWAVLVPLHAVGLMLAYRFLPAGAASVPATEISLCMLVALVPVGVVWDGLVTNAPRPAGYLARAALAAAFLLGTGLVIAWTAAGLGDLGEAGALAWNGAMRRVAACLGPSAALGLVWVIAARLALRREGAARA